MAEVADILGSLQNTTREVVSPEARKERFLEGIRQLCTENIPFIISADVDKNLCTYSSAPNEIPGLDPRGVVIDPNAREALTLLHELGIPIVISTARGAAEVSRYLQIPGITIIGSQGLEVRKVDDVEWEKGESKIDPNFEQYQEPMNAMMRDVYTRFVAYISEPKVKPEEVALPTEPVFEIPTPEGGRIVVQLKGQSPEYPLGIAMAFNVNQPIAGTPEDYIARQDKIRDIQQQYLHAFQEIFTNAWAEHFSPHSQESLAKIMTVRTRNESILYKGVRIPLLDLEVRPGMESGKGHAQIQLMRPENPKRQAHFKQAPFAPVTIFSGDSMELTEYGYGQDYAPPIAGHKAFHLTHGQGGVIGIQTLRPGEEDQQIPYVDMVVNGPAGLGNLLMEIAQVVRESKQTQ